MFKIAEQQKRFSSFKIRPLRSWRVCLEFKSVWYYPKVSPLLTTRQCDISKWQNVRLGVIGGWEYKHRKSRMLKNPSLQYMEAIEQTLKWGGRIGGLLAQSAKLTKSFSLDTDRFKLSPDPHISFSIILGIITIAISVKIFCTTRSLKVATGHITPCSILYLLVNISHFHEKIFILLENCSLFFLHGKCRHIIRSQQGDPAAETGNASSFVR